PRVGRDAHGPVPARARLVDLERLPRSEALAFACEAPVEPHAARIDQPPRARDAQARHGVGDDVVDARPRVRILDAHARHDAYFFAGGGGSVFVAALGVFVGPGAAFPGAPVLATVVVFAVAGSLASAVFAAGAAPGGVGGFAGCFAGVFTATLVPAAP